MFCRALPYLRHPGPDETDWKCLITQQALSSLHQYLHLRPFGQVSHQPELSVAAYYALDASMSLYYKLTTRWVPPTPSQYLPCFIH